MQIIINLGIEEKAFVELVQLWLPTIRHASFHCHILTSCLSYPHMGCSLPSGLFARAAILEADGILVGKEVGCVRAS